MCTRGGEYLVAVSEGDCWVKEILRPVLASSLIRL